MSEVIEQNRVDAAVANVTKMFSGNAAHMASSFYTNDKYFAHTAESITSGFLTPEQTPITLYDKLQDLQNQLTMIIEQINGTMGNITVNLIDSSDEEKVYTLNEGGTTYINAGDYLSAVNNLAEDKRKGAIITKTYYLDVSTDAQSGLFLLSKITGDRTSMCPNTITDNNKNIVNETVPYIGGNDYSNYDNVITPTSTSGSYYYEQGRYDIVPINLTNPDLLDFHIGSPSMYQSAQCRGQFIYSRFRNIGDTFDMYANSGEAKNPEFKYNAGFMDSEVTYSKHEAEPSMGADGQAQINRELCDEYNILTGSDEMYFNENMCLVLNRLPRTWMKPETATKRILGNDKTVVRLSRSRSSNDNANVISDSVRRLSGRLSRLATNSSSYTIVPKIQCAYGYADLGNIHSSELSFDSNPTFVTTHKIGYEDRDRYAKGPSTCNSYLFLSPVNHSEIQVDGDTLESSKKLKAGETLRVPLIYQFRMTDYNSNEEDKTGLIFGVYSTENNLDVSKTKYANIIGIDIWTDRNALKPKQYDIIIYSTYGSTIETNTNRAKTSSKQTLINVGNEIVNKLDKLSRDSKTISSVPKNSVLK